jgi:2-oxoisovalerate dehydrogenase E1 component
MARQKLQSKTNSTTHNTTKSIQLSPAEILRDYRIACISRQVSIIGRKEVLTGKAKFGIFGDGKEVAQLAMARSFQDGDWRSGYYRDQTFMFAKELLTVRQYFAQLYADPDTEREPASGGRQMNGHFATKFISKDGNWLSQKDRPNVSADISPTAGQMPRALGLAYASKLYRQVKELGADNIFSDKGNEVAFATIGDASTSEGVFWETLNAAGVLQVPLLISVWDDGYGISVPKSYQTTKESISTLLQGFDPRIDQTQGITIETVNGWDYPALLETYNRVVLDLRKNHAPALIHVEECTQPLGHSTSGSHERYKTPERMQYELDMDCLKLMRQWIIDEKISTSKDLEGIENEALNHVKLEQAAAWKDYIESSREAHTTLTNIFEGTTSLIDNPEAVNIMKNLNSTPTIRRCDIHLAARRLSYTLLGESAESQKALQDFIKEYDQVQRKAFTSHLMSESCRSPLNVDAVAVEYDENAESIPASQVLQLNFERLFENDQRIFAIGEDVGKLGDVNRGLDGIQEKFGHWRCTDTGIREATILGQGIGAAMRGLRPIADIQYLDYVLYCFQPFSDDLATLHYRSAGQQSAPLIVRTRGHRLEGVWHTGSPMGVMLNGLKGVHLCVPRNMTQAAGMYNTLLKGDDPALVIEVLNGYRLREKQPSNLGEFRVPLGVPEIMRDGSDLTMVSYGATLKICAEAAEILANLGLEVELIDVQTLMPFDRIGVIHQSLERTNALCVVDEDVQGGASAYITQMVLERDNGYQALDSKPITIAAADNRSAYGSDGDYYCKPSAEDIVEAVIEQIQNR